MNFFLDGICATYCQFIEAIYLQLLIEFAKGHNCSEDLPCFIYKADGTSAFGTADCLPTG